MDPKPIALFTRQRPYYIVADDYSRTESRTKVIHQLCHALNLIGVEAYLLTGHASSGLRTPTLSSAIEQKHQEAGLQPIVVYPEDVPGNPLKAASAVRYLYRSAASAAVWGDCFFVADKTLTPDEDSVAHILQIPLTNGGKYCPAKEHGEKWLAYTGGYPDARSQFAELLANCELIDDHHPATEERLIALLQKADRLYCFGESALSVEATLCACPVIYIPAPLGAAYPASQFAELPDCFAIDDAPDALEIVRGNFDKFRQQYSQAELDFAEQLRQFVAITQALPVVPRAESVHEELPESPLLHWITMRNTRHAIDGRIYRKWRANRTLQEIDGQLMAERMVREWPVRPCFQLFVELGVGEDALLADTMDSLAAQLYQDWRLNIISPLAAPDGFSDPDGKVQWMTVVSEDSRDAALSGWKICLDTDWCALVHPGIRFEPFALQMLGDYLARCANWLFAYSDEDLVAPGGALSDPRFKPDLNLDLLRSIDYLGGFCPVNVAALKAVGGFGNLKGAESYDVALRVLDRYGPSAIGHISEVLYHSPIASQRALPIESERQAVVNHLTRWRLTGLVQDGHGLATRRVIYRHETNPRVSVVILSNDKAEFLGPCLDSLFGRTRYSDFEVLILDTGNTEPDARALIDRLATNQLLPLRVIACPADYGLASQYNAAAELATGEYLLFLDDDCVVLQDDWLERMVASACRPEVGMVGPRFASPGQHKIHDTGMVLGFRGLSGSPYSNVLDAEASGYLGYKTLDQNVSALSSAGFLVRTSLFKRLEGFQTQKYPREHAILDFCLRVNKSGHWIVWTPYVTLARYGSSSRIALPKETSERTKLILAEEAESDALLKEWLPVLAKDPFYNRNLSLSDGYQLDHRATVDWDVCFHDRKRLIGFPLPGGSGEYRIIAPFRAISRVGLAQTSVVHSERKNMRVLSLLDLARAEPDVVVVHQAVERTQLALLEAYKKYLPNIQRVTGLDDLVSLLPPKHPSYRKRAVDIRPRLRASLNLCDRVIVSTEPLAELCRPLIDQVVVMPNCLEWDIWGGIEARRAPSEKPRVGWVGAQQHYGDLEHIFDVVQQLSDEVDWVFMGMCPDPIRKYVKEFHPWASGFAAYSSKMASLNLDLAIAPLDLNPFNEAKSNLRLLEYGVMRWPVVCTDIYPYQNAPVTRVSNTTQAWVNAIREKVSDRDAARREGEALRQWVEANFILENQVAGWLKAYSGD